MQPVKHPSSEGIHTVAHAAFTAAFTGFEENLKEIVTHSSKLSRIGRSGPTISKSSSLYMIDVYRYSQCRVQGFETLVSEGFPRAPSCG